MPRPFEIVPRNGTDQPPFIPLNVMNAMMIPQQTAQVAGMMVAVMAQQSATIGQAMNYMMTELKRTQRELRSIQRAPGQQMPGMPQQIVVYRGELDVYGNPKPPPQPGDFCSPRSTLGPASPPPYRVEPGGFF